MKNNLIVIFFTCAGIFMAGAQNQPDGVLALSMDDAISYALDSSYQTQAAMQDVYRAQKQIWEATAIGLPQISASADYNYNIEVPATPIPAQFFDPDAAEGETFLAKFGTKQSLGGSVSASQLIFDGSYIVGLQSARTVAAIADLAKEKTDVLVKEAVSNAYVGVLVSQESLEILEKNITNVKQNVKEIQALYDNGMAEEQDVEQLQLTLSNLENSLNQNQRMAKINAEMLKFAMGMDIARPIELTDDIDKVLLANYEVTALDEVLDVNDHIDFLISQNNLKTKDLLIRYEKTKYMPNLGAFFSAGYNSYSEIFDFFEFNNDQWAGMAVVGLQLNVPIFSSFQRKARVDMAKIDYEKTRLEHEQLIQNLFRELHVAQDAYAFSIDNYLTKEKNMQLAESIERKESVKYQEGISTSLDLANAQNQLYSSQQNYLNAILTVVQAKVALDKALNKL